MIWNTARRAYGGRAGGVKRGRGVNMPGMSDEELARMREVAALWHRTTGDVVRVVHARMRQLALRGEVPSGLADLLDHPDLAALDLALDNWYGDGDGAPGVSPG